jgi:glycosyltransferase involved in cell wall biosynthesis
MKLSVIVLCYNFEKYIEQCLYSILSQRTNFDFEILIRDDCSTDKSSSIIDRLAGMNPNIRFIKGKDNIGFSKSYEELLNLSKGEYIAYTDGDDYWLNNNKLQRQVDFLETNKSYVMCCTGYWQKDENENYLPKSPNLWMCPDKNQDTFDYTTTDYLEGNPTHFGRVFRKNPNTFHDYMHSLPILDWPLNFELSYHGKIKFLDFPSGVYRRHNKSLSSTNLKNKVGVEVYHTINKIYNQRIEKNG